MKDIQAELFDSFLIPRGLTRDGACCGFNPAGTCYVIPEERGKGCYWLYSCENLFAISIQDFVVYEDFFMEYPQPDYVSVSCFDSISGEELSPYKRLTSSSIKGHIGHHNMYRAVYHKNVPVQCTSIMIMPEYYRHYLQKRYPGEYEDPREAFRSVDGSVDFPELLLLLRQIKACRHTGIAAKLFYESKVGEAISLIVHKTKERREPASPREVSPQDMERLAAVKQYIDEYFMQDIQLDSLARMACMSATKLKYTFKQGYACTVFDYLHRKRMGHAEHLLASTDYSIWQISQMVGYQKASNFSGAFRKSRGLLPSEYRKLSAPPRQVD